MGSYTATPRTWATNDVVTAAMLNADVRDFVNAHGALTSYTPTLTGWTKGNGTVSGGYCQVQKMVWFYAMFVFGSTSAAASAVPELTLPAPGLAPDTVGTFEAKFIDDSTGDQFLAGVHSSTTSKVAAYILGTSGTFTVPSTTTPFAGGATWTTNDSVVISGTYWAA